MEGKVKSITNFGAFISLPENKTGMVHISEIANTYVSDIHQHLTEGQDVKVMVINVDGSKINLSLKRLEARPARREGGSFHNGPRREGRDNREGRENRENREDRGSRPSFHAGRPMHSAPAAPAAPKTADQLFEEKLKQFMSESDSKISSIRQYSDHRTRSRRR